MPQFILKINLGNEAMQTGDDVSVSLKEIATLLKGNGDFGFGKMNIRDTNGNTVGLWMVK